MNYFLISSFVIRYLFTLIVVPGEEEHQDYPKVWKGKYEHDFTKGQDQEPYPEEHQEPYPEEHQEAI